MTDHFRALQSQPTDAVRAEIRAARYQGHTAGLGPNRLQANLAILPAEYALDFMRFCQRNPKPCPLVGVSDTGDPMMRTLGEIDIRSDLPAYYVYRSGALAETVTDLMALWQDDYVAFALGCSFTFEHALMAAGLPLWHVDANATVPMFASSLQTVPAGPFGGQMVVSMRMIPEARVDEVINISRRYPMAHGGPVHWGDPEAIGITDLSQPEWGDAAPVLAGHVPMFWACGVTPQVAIQRAKLPLAITHKPGHMLITDVADDAETTILKPNQNN